MLIGHILRSYYCCCNKIMSDRARIQLQISENVGLFDYFIASDSFVAATKSSISLHPLDSVGSPKQQVEYDIGANPFYICVQQLVNNAVFATVDEQLLAIWDLATFTLSDTFFCTRMREDSWSSFAWSSSNSALFLSGSRKGVVSLWDRRADEAPLQTCCIPQQQIWKIDCPSHAEHSVYIKAGNNYLVWLDMRMLTNSLPSEESTSKRVISWIKAPHNIQDFVVREVSSDVVLLYDNFCLQSVIPSSFQLSTEQYSPSFDSYIQQDYRPHTLMIDEHTQEAAMLCRDGDRQQTLCVLFPFTTNSPEEVNNTKNPIYLPIKDIDKIHEPIKSCFWRGVSGAERQLMAVSAGGTVYSLHAQLLPNKNNKGTLEHRTPRFASDKLKKVLSVSVSVSGERLWADLSPRELLTPISQHGRMVLHHENTTSSSSTVRTVVGPVRFRLLLADEIRALEVALSPKSHILEGMSLISINEFSRTIVLESSLQMPSVSSGLVRHHSNPSLSHHFLMNLNSALHELQSIPSITIVLTFPKKISNFWLGIAVSLENRSSRPLDMEQLRGEVITAMQPLLEQFSRAKATAAQSSMNSTATTMTSSSGFNDSNHRFGARTTPKNIDFSSYLLFNLAKLIRDTIHAFCEKEKILQSQRQQQLAGEVTGQSPTDSPTDDLEVADLTLSMTTSSTHTSFSNKKYRTPFPCLSGGIFSATGRLCLFGNAEVAIVELRRENGRRMNYSEAINFIPPKLYLTPNVLTLPSSAESAAGESKGDEFTQPPPYHHSPRHLSLAAFIRAQSSATQYIPLVTKQQQDLPLPRLGGGSRVTSPQYHIGKEVVVVPRASSKEDAVTVKPATAAEGITSNSEYSSAALSLLRPISSPTSTLSAGKMVGSLNFISNSAAEESAPQRNNDEMKPLPNFIAVTTSLLSKEISLASKYVFLPSRATTPERIEATRHNAKVIQTTFPLRRDLHQFWILLGVTMDVLDMDDNHGLMHCDPLSWSSGALGRSMLTQLFEKIAGMSAITVACGVSVIGGLQQLCELCELKNESHSRTLLQGLLRQAVKLFRHWGISTIAAAQSSTLIPATLLASFQERLVIGTFCQPCEETYAKLAAVAASPRNNAASSKNMRKTVKGKKRRASSSSSHDLSSGISSRNSNTMSNKSRSESSSGTSPLASSTPQMGLSQRCTISSLVCSICQKGVDEMRLIAFCMWCGHGGHEQHLRDWFDAVEECPLGCGCKCRSTLALPAETVNNASGEEDEAVIGQDISTHSSGRFIQAMFTTEESWNM